MTKLKSILTDSDFLPKLANLAAAGVALLLVVVGMIKPWLTVPVMGEDGFVTQDSSLTLFFKIALVGVFLFFLLFSKGRFSGLGRKLSFAALISVLIIMWFPSWVTMRDAKVMGDAAWLQQQHDNLTWLGGDVYRAHSDRSDGWGGGVNAQDPPSRLALYRTPDGSISPERVTDWIWWLGYGPGFTQFVGKGWFYSLFGFSLGLICLVGHAWRKDLSGARLLLRKLSSRGGVFVILLLSVNVVIIAKSGRDLNRSKEAMTQGDYSASERHLASAIHWLPTLECDSGVLRQLGYLALKTEGNSVNTSLYTINHLEEEGYYARARDLLIRTTVDLEFLPENTMRELLRHEVRVAINEMNSGRYQQAGKRLDRVIRDHPAILQARFHRQLIALHTGDLEKCREMNQSLIELYEHFKSKNKRGVIAASWLMMAQAELDAGNVTKAGEARQKSKGL